MLKLKNKNKAVAMLVVLGTLIIIFVLAGTILVITSSQSRFVHHQVSRIQAYYAAMAGFNYAYERLYTGAWSIPPPGSPVTYSICRSAGFGCTYVESFLPHTVSRINISIAHQSDCPSPPPGISACINATAIYTYSPP